MKKPDRLYELLPSVYRQRDAEQGYPLKALLRVISEQVDLVEDDIDRLYRNWFIETCEDWVVPYLGDLIGYRPVHEGGDPGDPNSAGGRALNQILIPRRDVANTIRNRRRKGTLALLEELAADAAGWPARAIEDYRHAAWQQHLDHRHPRRGRTADLHDANTLARLDDAFDSFAHTVDVRRPNSGLTPGRPTLPGVGVSVWRLRSCSVTKTPALCVDGQPHCFTFSVLGNHAPLYNRPRPEDDPTGLAGELNLPVPISRPAFEGKAVDKDKLHYREASGDYYGGTASMEIWAPDWPHPGAPQPLPLSAIIAANLNEGHPRVPRNHVAVDPELGRIVFPTEQRPRRVSVRYHYGFSADLGGGEYDRPLSQPAEAAVYRVGHAEKIKSIGEALAQWSQRKSTLRRPATGQAPAIVAAVIEITDSGVYSERLNLVLDESESLQLRAARGVRPVIRLLDHEVDQLDAFAVSGGPGSRLALDGLLIFGRGLYVSGPDESRSRRERSQADLCDVTIRHCTLVPGWSLHCNCEPRHATEPSVTSFHSTARFKIEHSILGPILVVADEHRTEPVRIDISDSIWDATADNLAVLGGNDDRLAYAKLTVARCTVLGSVQTHEIPLAENSIFTGEICVARRQSGCMRFCYIPPGFRTPRRYECQPDMARRIVTDKFLAAGGQMSEAERDTELAAEELRVEPEFNSTRYGTPTYCQLAGSCADEIKRGADDESEMGAFHDLFQPQRAANLQARLDEYTPAGMDAGIIYAS